MDLNIETNKWYSKKELKQIIQSEYNEKNIQSTAKASDIKLLYNVVEKQTRINGVQTFGYYIIDKL